MTKTELLEKYHGVTPLSDELTDGRRPIVLYGTGNGADKIIDYLATLGRAPDAVFASDGFVRSRTFAGMTVESFSDVSERYGKDMKILVCFGSDREEVMSRIQSIASEFDLALPDVPLYGEGIFDRSYLDGHIDELLEARSMLEDDRSRELFDLSVLYRLTGKITYLGGIAPVGDIYREMFSRGVTEYAVDGGAYRGDSAALMAKNIKGIKRIYALEPDPTTFKKLSENAKMIDGAEVVPICVAASDRCGETVFSGSSSRGAGVSGRNRRAKERRVTTATVDSLSLGKIDLIKLDVEGDEAAALTGAAGTMSEYAPSLAVSLYHRTEDLYRLPIMIKNSSADYAKMKYYLRRPPCFPCWDLTLFAVKEK